MPRRRKNDWVILYDDGETPQIHRVMVSGYTMYDALHTAHRDIQPAQIWACALVGHEQAAGFGFARVSGEIARGDVTFLRRFLRNCAARLVSHCSTWNFSPENA